MTEEKKKVYIETTVVSYLTARPSKDLIIAAHQQLTKEWWKNRRGRFDLFVSQLVLQESGAGDKGAASERLTVLAPLPVLELTQESLALARELVRKKAVPQKAELDALPHFGSRGSGNGLPAHMELQAHCKCRDAVGNLDDLFVERI